MEIASTVDFANAARVIGRAARRSGLDAPSYRCPPRIVGADRTIRRRPSGAVVSVRVKGRQKVAVLADMIEGVVAANRLVTPLADRVRTELWRVVDGSFPTSQPTPRTAPRSADNAPARHTTRSTDLPALGAA